MQFAICDYFIFKFGYKHLFLIFCENLGRDGAPIIPKDPLSK